MHTHTRYEYECVRCHLRVNTGVACYPTKAVTSPAKHGDVIHLSIWSGIIYQAIKSLYVGEKQNRKKTPDETEKPKNV